MTKTSETSEVVEVTKEEQLHIDARDARVKVVEAGISAAKVKRDEQSALGTMETPGVTLDREAKEAKDLAEAQVVYKIEPFGIDSTNPDMVMLATKLSEVIKFINKA